MDFHEVVAPFLWSRKDRPKTPQPYLEYQIPVPWPHWLLRQLINVDPALVFGHKWLVWGLYDLPEFESYSAVVSGERALELSAPALWIEEEVGIYRIADRGADLNLWADDGKAGLRILDRSTALPLVKEICHPSYGINYTDKLNAIWIYQDAPIVSYHIEDADLVDVLTIVSSVTNDSSWSIYDGAPFPAWTLTKLEATKLTGAKMSIDNAAIGLMSLFEWSAGFRSVEALHIHTEGDREFRTFLRRMSATVPGDPIAPAMPPPLSLERISDRTYTIVTRKGESSERLIHLLQKFQEPLGWGLSGDGLPG